MAAAMTPVLSPALLLSLTPLILLPRCGCMDIVRGEDACPHSWPYMAALQSKDLRVFCGGALVERQWVLTAARCGFNESEYRVVLGAHQPSIAEKEQQIFKVKRSFRNPQYNTSSKENDIMLLKGDSGGPLICDGQYNGIVAFGKGCGKRGIPGIYTQLTKSYINWIKKIIFLHRNP